MISVHMDSILVQTPEEGDAVCWCGLPASYTLDLINPRQGTGRFKRCRVHARRDLETGDFKLLEVRI